MLDHEQIDFYNEQGYLRIPVMFTKEDTDELSDDLDRLVQDWAFTNEGWTGPWRQAYMDPETESWCGVIGPVYRVKSCLGSGNVQSHRIPLWPP
jgi:hypothetical protein